MFFRVKIKKEKMEPAHPVKIIINFNITGKQFPVSQKQKKKKLYVIMLSYHLGTPRVLGKA